MYEFHSLPQRLGAAVVALSLTIAPLAVVAQDIPSYARSAYVSTDETIHGRIRSVDGAFTISVDDDRGFVDSVQLHQGTIINPTGLTLSSGMSVTILGVNAGSAFDANEIDTPYSYAGLLPTPIYYGPGYWCPGFAYGYGPSFSLAIVIGGGDRPWYFEHRPFYGRPWDGRGYFGEYIGRGPESRGRVEARRSFGDPAVRAETRVHTAVRTPSMHVPPAFAGRSFAGEPRVNVARGSIETNGREQHSTRMPAGDARNSYAQEVESRGSPSGGNYSRGSVRTGGYAAARAGGYAPARAGGYGPARAGGYGPARASGGGYTAAGAGGYAAARAGGYTSRAVAPSHSGGSGGHAR